MNQLPHWILTSGPPNVTRPTRLTFAVDPAAGKLYYWDTLVWRDITGGGGSCFPATYVIWVCGQAPPGGDGKFCTPFNTIQAAINSIPAGSTPATARATWVVLIAPGTYDEDLNINGSERNIVLMGMGPVNIGLFNNAGWTASNTRNITWDISAPLVDGIMPSLHICTMQTDEIGTIPWMAYSAAMRISGGIRAQSSVSVCAVLSVTAEVNQNIDHGTGFIGTLWVNARRSAVFGNVNLPQASLTECYQTLFSGTVTADSVFLATECAFQNGITLTSAPSPAGFIDCYISGSFIGPANSAVFNGTTYRIFITNGATMVPPASLVLLDQGIAPQVDYVPATPTDWVPPLTVPTSTVQEALDQIGARVRAIETSGVAANLFEDFLSGDPLIAIGDAVCHDPVSDTVSRAVAAAPAPNPLFPARGFAVALLPGNIVRVKWQGSVNIPGGGLVPGNTYYLDLAVLGGITNADTSVGPPGSIVQEVGYARNANTLFALIDGDFTYN